MLVRICVTSRYGNGKTHVINLVRRIRNPNSTLGSVEELELKNKISKTLVTKNNFRNIKEIIFTHEVIEDNNTAKSYININSYKTETYDDRDQIIAALLDNMYICFNISNKMITGN